jgi:hypothetical protein
MIDGGDCEAVSGMDELKEKLKYWEKIYPGAALSTTDPTCLDLGSNRGRYDIVYP